MTAAPIALRPAFSFTHHAIARFITRVWPKISDRPCADGREALSILADAIPRAEVMPRRSSMGDTMWSVADPAMRWITRPGEFRGRRVAVVVTVLDGLEDVEAEAEAEREVMEAHRRLEAVPEIGAPTTPAPPPGPADIEAPKAYKAWLALEAQRLSLERERVRKLNVPQVAALEHARLAIVQRRLQDERDADARRERTRRHAITQAHCELVRDLVDRLAEVDPAGSVELLERARARVAKWAAEGRLAAPEPGDKAAE